MYKQRLSIRNPFGRRESPLQRELMALQEATETGISRKLQPLTRALSEGDEDDIVRRNEEAAHYLEVLATTDPLIARIQAADRPQNEHSGWVLEPSTVPALPQVPTYWISSATLADAFAYLTQGAPGDSGEPEWMLAVTGLHLKELGLRTLEHLVEVRMRTQSVTEAAFDMQDFTRIAVTMHSHGQALQAIFHSHRFAGPPQPSATDWRLDEVLREGGYPAIQAVFSEDAYVRFFRRRPFTIQVYGKGVETINGSEHLYRIVHSGTLPHPRHAFGERGKHLRSLPAHSGR